jgi:hypothetical protein
MSWPLGVIECAMYRYELRKAGVSYRSTPAAWAKASSAWIIHGIEKIQYSTPS